MTELTPASSKPTTDELIDWLDNAEIRRDERGHECRQEIRALIERNRNLNWGDNDPYDPDDSSND